MSKRVNRSERELMDILVAAALLHDIGKSFTMKKTIRAGYEKLTFPFHEHVSAAIVLAVAYYGELGVKDKKDLYDVARIVARHHAAMEGRHPHDLHKKGSNSLSEAFVNAMSKLDEKTLRCLSYSLTKSPYSNDLLKIINDHLSDALRGLKNSRAQLIDIVKPLRIEDEEERRKALVYSLSGMLIVADGVVASYCENRGSESVPAYVEHWRHELGDRMKEAIRACCQSAMGEHGCSCDS